MRTEQYFLMTDYSLWERLARKNELKARATLLMALPDKHQLKFNIHKDAKTLMEAIEKRTHTLIWRNKTYLEEQSLDDLFNRLKKICEAEVKSSSSASTSTQNIAFVSCQNTKNTNETVSAVASVSAASAKIPISALPNVDTLSNAIIYSFFASQSNSSQLDNDDLKQIDDDDLEEMDLKWQMAMWSATTATGKDTLLESVGEEYHAVPPPYTGTFMPLKPDLVFHDAPNVNEPVHIAFNVELSPTKPDKELPHRPSAPIIEDWVSDSEDDSEAELPQNALSFVHPTEQVKTPRPSVKPVETSILAANHKTTIPKPKSHGNSRNRKAYFMCKSLTHLIKDCDYYEKKMAQTPARNHAQKGNH
nr:hypothetical protein [Tanacetum cinerariifolium]